MVGYKDPPKDKQFKPGQSGNPTGMPKGYKSFRTRMLEVAEKEIDFKDFNNKKIRTKAGEALVLALYAKAMYKGDAQAAKIILEHLEGKKVVMGGDEENPLRIVYENAKKELAAMSPEAILAIDEIANAVKDDSSD